MILILKVFESNYPSDSAIVVKWLVWIESPRIFLFPIRQVDDISIRLFEIPRAVPFSVNYYLIFYLDVYQERRLHVFLLTCLENPSRLECLSFYSKSLYLN